MTDPDPTRLTQYIAPVRCINCGYTGDVTIPVGQNVWSQAAVCPVCQVSGRLRPDNEHWHEEQRARNPRS